MILGDRNRAGMLLVVLGFGASVMACSATAKEGPKPVVAVYATPTCGCCVKWVDHLRSAGFDARKVNVQNLDAVKREHGVTSTLASCHTAVVDGYVVEGHVPADVVWKLLEERPDVVGIAVPDMPLGSPGMEVPGRAADSYDVLAFDHQGRVTVFASR